MCSLTSDIISQLSETDVLNVFLCRVWARSESPIPPAINTPLGSLDQLTAQRYLEWHRLNASVILHWFSMQNHGETIKQLIYTFTRNQKPKRNAYFFGQQVKSRTWFVVLKTSHGYFAVRPRVFIHDGDISVYNCADSSVLGHAERIRSVQELRRIVVHVSHVYFSPQRYRVRVRAVGGFV